MHVKSGQNLNKIKQNAYGHIAWFYYYTSVEYYSQKVSIKILKD